MKKIYTIYGLLGILLVLGAVGIFSFRLDLTKEKRYTLSDSSLKILKSVKKPMKIEVYLEGEFPASFKQLQGETKFMLEEFRKVNPKIDFKFIDPLKTKIPRDTLMAMGMEPSQLTDRKNGETKEIIMFPYAAVKYGGRGVSIPLIVEQSGIDGAEQLRRSIENLEYNFIAEIKQLVQEKRKNVGILVNQDELRPDEFRGFMNMAMQSYNAGPIVPKNGIELGLEDIPILREVDAIVIAKPRKAFTENEKVILDQYIMNGGKTLWMMDAVNAEMDTLFRASKIMAYPIDLNMTDFFFNYGVRINSGLIKDVKKSALIRIKTGEIAGNPQFSSFLWPYYPLGIAENSHPVTKNINPVKFEFPSSIDTLSRPGIKTTVLYESSERTLVKPVPNLVSLEEVVNVDSIAAFEKPSNPKIFAVSLEGKFKSAYASRSEKSGFPGFRSQGVANKMILISDGDVGRNQQLKGEPLPLGVDLLTKQEYGNAEFLRNALDFLLDDANLMELRNRNIEARLLDRQRIEYERSKWQWLNLLLPFVIIGGLAVLFFWLRKRKFGTN